MGINCGHRDMEVMSAAHSFTYNEITSIVEFAHSLFMSWLGGCAIRASCAYSDQLNVLVRLAMLADEYDVRGLAGEHGDRWDSVQWSDTSR